MHRMLVAMVSSVLLSGLGPGTPKAEAQVPTPGLELNTNRPGRDFRSVVLTEARPELCQQACAGEPQCQAFTYVKPGIQGPAAMCWLKSSAPDPVPDQCCVSGLKTGHPVVGIAPVGIPVQAPVGTAMGLEPNTNRPGRDIRSLALPEARPELCQKACADEPQCQAFTYVRPGIQGPSAVCWLKSPAPNPVPDPCCVSGVKSAGASAPASGLEADTDRPGRNLRSFALPEARPELCQKACADEPQCQAFTYVKPGIQGPGAVCWLKSPAPDPVPNPCCVSGLKSGVALAGIAKVGVLVAAPVAQAPAYDFEHAPGRVGPIASISFYMSDKKRFADITYQDIDGLAVFEGDMILGRSADLQKPRPRTSVPQCVGDVCSSTGALSARFGEAYLWPGGVIPFEVDPRFGAQGRAEIGAGVAILNTGTHLTVRPRQGERDYIVYVPSSGCSSWVGRQVGRQDVHVADPGCGAGGVAHETLHAAGLWHEQSRTDRDRYIRVLWGNIQPDLEHNFQVHASDGVDVGPYDLNSIMHYGATAFGKKDPATGRTLPTIETIPPGGNVGSLGRLTANDVAGLSQLYPMSSSERHLPIPGLVFGLRHSMNQANDFIQPFVRYGAIEAQRIHGGDQGAPANEGFYWWMIPTDAPLSSLRMEEIPPGVVLGLWHSMNMSAVPADFRLVAVRAGDLGAPSGQGFVWYETPDASRVNWDVVDMLPPYTVVGLKHSENQRNKTFVWRDGRTYDPLVACPEGFDRKDGGDRGASSGTGFYWCEKRKP